MCVCDLMSTNGTYCVNDTCSRLNECLCIRQECVKNSFYWPITILIYIPKKCVLILFYVKEKSRLLMCVSCLWNFDANGNVYSVCMFECVPRMTTWKGDNFVLFSILMQVDDFFLYREHTQHLAVSPPNVDCNFVIQIQLKHQFQTKTPECLWINCICVLKKKFE